MRTSSSSGDAALKADRIPELDGLRGLAILSVVLMHYFYSARPDLPRIIHYLQAPLALGWTGVDLFFVLSGFLIGGILLDVRESRSYFKTFYIRRFWRIIPLYYVWILIFIGLVGIGGSILRAHTRSGVLPEMGFVVYQHFLFLQNLWNVPYVKIAYWWFGLTWSLAIEEQFYLVAPLLIRFVSKRWLSVLLVLVIPAAFVARMAVRHFSAPPPWLAYKLMPCRADALAIGMLAAIGWRSNRFRRWLSANTTALYGIFTVLLAGMIVICIWFSNPNSLGAQSLGFLWIALFYVTLLLISIEMPSGPIARIMRFKWLRELGRVSYCVYIIHLAVAYFCFGLLLREIPEFFDWRTGLVGLFSMAMTYAIARSSWTWFERPLLQIGQRHTYKS